MYTDTDSKSQAFQNMALQTYLTYLLWKLLTRNAQLTHDRAEKYSVILLKNSSYRKEKENKNSFVKIALLQEKTGTR